MSDKPVRKLLIGGDSSKYLTFARRKLDQLNGNSDRPYQRKTMVVGGALVQITTSPIGDKMLINTSGGYIISMRVKATTTAGNVNATGEQIGTVSVLNYLFTAPKPRASWKLAGASPLPSTINADFLFKNVAGYGMDTAPQNGGPTPPSGGTDPDGRVFVTKNGAKSFEGVFWFSDSNRSFVAGHQVKPFIKAGKRGFWFISVSSSERAAKIATYMLGDDTATYYTLPGDYFSITGGSPIIDIVNPDKVFGLRADGTSNGPVYFFVATDGGATVQTFTSNDLFSAAVSFNRPINARRSSNLFALSDTKALLVTTDPNPAANFKSSWYLVDFTTGSTQQVLTGVGGKFVNMGNGVLLIQSLAVLNDARTAYVNYLYTSMDNGATWATSEAHVPQSTQMGESINYLASGAVLVPTSPYVNADSQGVVYTVSRISWTQDTAEYTDLRLFASKDLLKTWEQVATIQKREDYPKTSAGGTPVEYDFESALIVGVGTPAAPLAIDPIQPWRSDSKVSAPASWTMH